jgi:hypothetical protein
VAGGYIYVADGEAGLVILRFRPAVYLPLVMRHRP